jgi:16S rRNA (cytidine1402-2'-O)-methyltransferase
MSQADTGCLYLVATPIGNLDDMSIRAINTLKDVDLILAEDTRHSKKLLNHYAINTPMLAHHTHNENSSLSKIGEKLSQGLNIALISDAGSPLISDPGFPLVRYCQDKQFKVLVIPGPSAVISAVSASGLPLNAFCFEGFLKAKPSARAAQLKQLKYESKTTVFFESPHRLIATLQDVQAILPERELSLSKEITKPFETHLRGLASDLLNWLEQDKERQKGEFVLVISGNSEEAESFDAKALLEKLLNYLPTKQSAKLCAELSNIDAKSAYKLALELKKQPKC